jgi:hypothetical protein
MRKNNLCCRREMNVKRGLVLSVPYSSMSGPDKTGPLMVKFKLSYLLGLFLL